MKDLISTISDNQAIMSQSETKCICGEECAICKEPQCDGKPLHSTNCGHIFHEQCLKSWSKSG